jgi:peptide/nickel transport system substrate-binding protein
MMTLHRPKMALRIAGAAAVVAVVLSGCTTPTIVEGSEVGVAVAEPFTSLNPGTSFGRSSSTNADIASLTGGAFAYYDDAYRLVEDQSFGTAQIVAEDPLTVRYQLAADARWSSTPRPAATPTTSPTTSSTSTAASEPGSSRRRRPRS